ncbi:cell wall-binding repeat-containing protein [Buchananella felis]|uniref:cell wall-binding repeat-containing protein n=1 Tax=Buchananella felis TaxID=3231492 RepID=UPI003528182D
MKLRMKRAGIALATAAVLAGAVAASPALAGPADQTGGPTGGAVPVTAVAAEVTPLPLDGPPPIPPSVFERLAGPNRYATAAKVFEKGDWGPGVVLVSGENPYDALSATPLAAYGSAPLILTPRASLSPESRQALLKAKANGADVVQVVGGTSSISEAVENQVKALGFSVVVRHEGIDRYQTAKMITGLLYDAHINQHQSMGPILFVDGTNFADALAAGPAAATKDGAIMLTRGRTPLTAQERAYLNSLHAPKHAIGGAAVAATQGIHTERVVGTDRYDTAVEVASKYFYRPRTVVIASGLVFPDALSGGAFAANKNGPLVLTHPTSVPQPLRGYINPSEYEEIYVVGGPGSVSQRTFLELLHEASH